MYRLNTLTLSVPPLRERRDEIETLVATFVGQACRDASRETVTVSGEAMRCLLEYRWPGNIRELKNVIERAVVLCEENEILPAHLPLEKMRPAPGELVEVPKTGDRAETKMVPRSGRPIMNFPPLDDPEKEAERQRILDALDARAWSQTRAAELLGISRRTLVTKLDYYGVPRPQKGQRDEEPEQTKASQPVVSQLETPSE
jgi:DNA-binding NtrC family response regulator